MSLSLALLLGVIQGFAELFPLSSLGILVILPHALPIPFHLSGARYLPFVVAVHAGTALALLAYFRHDWARLIGGWLRWVAGSHNPDGRIMWLLIWATVPAGLAGLLLKHPLSHLFSMPVYAAIFLLANGLLLLVANRWHRQRARLNRKIPDLALSQGIKVGLFQMFALLPGLSRSGLSMAGGLLEGLSFEEAARLAFLLATPIIGAAAILELPHLVHHHHSGLLGAGVVGGIAAGVTAWLSTHFLLRYFQHGNLRVFAFLSFALGVVGLILVH